MSDNCVISRCFHGVLFQFFFQIFDFFWIILRCSWGNLSENVYVKNVLLTLIDKFSRMCDFCLIIADWLVNLPLITENNGTDNITIIKPLSKNICYGLQLWARWPRCLWWTSCCLGKGKTLGQLQFSVHWFTSSWYLWPVELQFFQNILVFYLLLNIYFHIHVHVLKHMCYVLFIYLNYCC